MNTLKVLVLVLTVAFGRVGSAQAGPMLTGSVSYDRASQLYTYSYALDDRIAPATIDVVLIRIATHVYDVFHLAPVSGTGPAPFDHFIVGSGGSRNEDAFASGTLYGWDAWERRPLTPGVYSGLSFTSRYGPGAENAPNYILYSHLIFNPDGSGVEVGRVVAPDLTNAPEPGALALVVIGLAAVLLRRFAPAKRSQVRAAAC